MPERLSVDEFVKRTVALGERHEREVVPLVRERERLNREIAAAEEALRRGLDELSAAFFWGSRGQHGPAPDPGLAPAAAEKAERDAP